MIIAHRGSDGVHKENSKDAIINSLGKYYVDGVEFDIRLTRDLKFIINHDPVYKNHFISETNMCDLKRIGLDSLEDVLDLINSKKVIMIEVKTDGKNIKSLSKRLYKILKRYSLNFYICSFNYDFIKYFSGRYRFKSGLIIGMLLNVKRMKNNFDFNSISYKYKGKILSKETFRWTINDPSKIVSSDENIITDSPKLIYDYLKSL